MDGSQEVQKFTHTQVSCLIDIELSKFWLIYKSIETFLISLMFSN
jgi:hypothetical protein